MPESRKVGEGGVKLTTPFTQSIILKYVEHWLMMDEWQGTDGLEAHIDTVFDNAQFFTEQIRHRPGFKLVLDKPECTNVCFWYTPPSLRGQETCPDFKDRLHKVLHTVFLCVLH